MFNEKRKLHTLTLTHTRARAHTHTQYNKSLNLGTMLTMAAKKPLGSAKGPYWLQTAASEKLSGQKKTLKTLVKAWQITLKINVTKLKVQITHNIAIAPCE